MGAFEKEPSAHPSVKSTPQMPIVISECRGIQAPNDIGGTEEKPRVNHHRTGSVPSKLALSLRDASQPLFPRLCQKLRLRAAPSPGFEEMYSNPIDELNNTLQDPSQCEGSRLREHKLCPGTGEQSLDIRKVRIPTQVSNGFGS
jgi:hypothetical protein